MVVVTGSYCTYIPRYMYWYLANVHLISHSLLFFYKVTKNTYSTITVKAAHPAMSVHLPIKIIFTSVDLISLSKHEPCVYLTSLVTVTG